MNGQIENCCCGLNIWVSSNTEGAPECLGFNSQNVLIISLLDMSYKHSRRDFFWCLVILLKANLRTRGCSLESILGNYKENLSSPASHIPSLSSVIASLLLNPLNYSHNSVFNPLSPVLQSLFLGRVFFFGAEPFLRPSAGSLTASTPPPPSVSRRLLCEAHIPG